MNLTMNTIDIVVSDMDTAIALYAGGVVRRDAAALGRPRVR
jgi:hypothetical protein